MKLCIFYQVDEIEYDVDLDFLKPKAEPTPEPNIEPQTKPVSQVPAVDRKLKPNLVNSNKANVTSKNSEESSNFVQQKVPSATPIVPDRASKPTTVSSTETNSRPTPVSNSSQGEAAQVAAEHKQLQELMNRKQVEYTVFKKDNERMIAEHKARQARLESDQKALDNIQNSKDKQLRETADLMRQKRKIEEELRQLEKEREARNSEGQKRYIPFKCACSMSRATHLITMICVCLFAYGPLETLFQISE